MTPDELAPLRLPRAPDLVLCVDLRDLTPRTLVYGYDLDRRTVHIYLIDDDGIPMFVVARYKGGEGPDSKVTFKVQTTVGPDDLPSKRAYPEACDFEFGRRAHACGLDIPYTSYDITREQATFHGRVVEGAGLAKMRSS